jgi:hypothetical protein
MILLCRVTTGLFNENASKLELQPPNGYGSSIMSLINNKFRNPKCVCCGKKWIRDTTSQDTKLGDRLLEIIALKIFGNAEARAAIVNDTEFTSDSELNTIISSFTNSLSTDQNFIFSQYVALGRISNTANELVSQNFNFDNMNIALPMYLQGSIPNTVSDTLKNGYVGASRSTIVNYNYNIPLMLVVNGQ